MRNEHYYVYCKGILGVKTNIRNFKWIYGSTTEEASFDEYQKCIVKFNVDIKPEKDLDTNNEYTKKFQAYSWNAKKNCLFYQRKFLSALNVGYNVEFNGNTVTVNIGKKYFQLIKPRIMNLHGTYYLLSDIANMVLLKNGFFTLYASAVHHTQKNKGIICFAPPNTGKTITAIKLCEFPEYRLVGEDIIITDGNKLFSCPFTSSYRNAKSTLDSAGSIGRVHKNSFNNVCYECNITDMITLSLGSPFVSSNKDEVLRQINILNGYLFNHYSSPIIKILGYFSQEYDVAWSEKAKELTESMANICDCRQIQSDHALNFYTHIHRMISGDTL